MQDAALVEACQLSDRYITARKLPDKAIDLVDEACASGTGLLEFHRAFRPFRVS